MNIRDTVALACVIVFVALCVTVGIMYAIRAIKQRRHQANANFTSVITYEPKPRHQSDLPPAELASVYSTSVKQ
jgi:hypothetical protein